MEHRFEVDYDNEKVLVDDRWLGKDDLAGMLAERLASMDYNIGKLSAALEFLDRSLKSLETFSVKLSPEVAAQLRQMAQSKGLAPGAVIREAVVSYLIGAALSKLGQ
ncbi:MAG: hypothetical protein D6806_00275 [Deltaproteobacteria bacterium]|nr:MAG: hypothetical protein D6806_00275 [Deltaproteobacteria bacterium]